MSWGSPADPFTTALPARDTTAPEQRGAGGGAGSVDEQSGAASYTVPIEVPAGRAGMAPSLALSYSSQNPLRGGLAVGWSLGLSTIERDPDVLDGIAYRAGGQRLVSAPDDPWQANLPDSPQQFRAEHDGSFARYELRHGVWKVTTLDGLTRSYALAEPGTRWHLTQQLDALGNSIVYRYEWSQAGPDAAHQYTELVLRSIEYTANQLAGLAAHARVELGSSPVATCGGIPMGASIDHRFGALRMRGSRQLDEVTVSVRDTQTGPWRRSRSYTLRYDQAEANCSASGLRYLTSVGVSASDAAGHPTVLPPLTFAYGPATRTLDQAIYLPDFGGGERGTSHGPTTTLLDFDSDGWIDRLAIHRVLGDGVTTFGGCELEVTRGTGVGQFAATSTVIDLPSAPWHDGMAPRSLEGCTLAAQSVFRGQWHDRAFDKDHPCGTDAAIVSYHFLDWDGDGLVDIVTSLHETRPGIANGDFEGLTSIAQKTGDGGGGGCGSCPQGTIESGCTKDGRVICACPGDMVSDGSGGCSCAPGTSWDGFGGCVPPEQCEGPDCFPTGPDLGDPGDQQGGFTACALPEPLPEPTSMNSETFKLYVQHNTSDQHRDAGEVCVEPFDRTRYASSPVSLPAGASPMLDAAFQLPRFPELFDITGDGLLDALLLDGPRQQGNPSPLGDGTHSLWVFPGTGGLWSEAFEVPQTWKLPTWSQHMSGPSWSASEGVATSYGTFELRDLNADGLPDIVAQQPDGTLVVLHNTGVGHPWDSTETAFGPPLSLDPNHFLTGAVVESRTETTPSTSGLPQHIVDGQRAHLRQLVDVDDDGYPEYLRMYVNHTVALDAVARQAYRLNGGTNPGTAFSFLRSPWEALEQQVVSVASDWYRASDALDLTGDGRADMVTWLTRFDDEQGTGGQAAVYTDRAGEAPLRVLTSIDNGHGAVTRFEYASSTEPGMVDLGEGHLSARPLVRRIVVGPSGEVSGEAVMTTTYSYGDPHHGVDGPLDRGGPSFQGFGSVTVEHSGQLGADSNRTITSFDFTPLGLDWTGRLADTQTWVKQLDGSFALADHTHHSWRNLVVQGDSWAPSTSTVPDVVTTSTCAAGATAASCATSPAAFTAATETWTPYRASASSPVLLYQRTASRVVGSDVVGARVSTQRYEVSTVGGMRRQVLAEVSEGDGVVVLARTETKYDARLLPVETWSYRENDLILTSRRGFDQIGNLIWTMTPSQVAGDQRVASIEYDSHLLYPTYATNELGHTVVTEHDVATGAQLASWGPNPGDFDEVTIDGLGRVLEHRGSTAPDGQVRLLETFAYQDSLFNYGVTHTAVQDHDTGAVVIDDTYLDGLGRVIAQVARRQVTDEPDAETRYAYDQGGGLLRTDVPDPSGVDIWVTYQWSRDGLGRTIQTVRPDGSGEDVAYLGLDTIVRERTPQGTTTTFHKDALGQVRWVQEHPETERTSYDYDGLGRIVGILDADQQRTGLGYDMQGNRTAINRGGRTWSYGYDRDGRVEREQAPVPAGAHAEDYASKTTYDALGRVLETSPATRDLAAEEQARLGVGLTAYVYDTQRIGSLARVTLPFGELDFEVDAVGQVRRASRTITVPGTDVVAQQHVDLRHDALGALTSTRWDDDTEWRFQYDARSMVSEATWVNPANGQLELLAHYTRGVAGNPVQRKSEGGQTREWTYDVLGRPTYDRIWSDTTGLTFGERGYGYDGDEVAEVWGSNNGLVADASYAYDARHRLVGARGPLDYDAILTFGPTGNVTHAVVRGALDTPDRDVKYVYADFDPQAVEALVATDGAKSLSMDYDLQGNVVQRTGADGSKLKLTWDGDDQLREVDDNRNGTETYLFGPGAERIAAIGLDGVKVWFGDSETHFDLDGAQQHRYHHIATGEPIARITDGKQVELQYADIMSNLMMAIDTDDRVTGAFLYGAFGEVVAEQGEQDHRRLFNGKEHDRVSGLRHYGYRSYDPLTLRWVSADPKYRFAPDAAWAEPQRANLYAFSLNNPMRWVDPDGLDNKKVHFIGDVIDCALGKCRPTVVTGTTTEQTPDSLSRGEPDMEHPVAELTKRLGHLILKKLAPEGVDEGVEFVQQLTEVGAELFRENWEADAELTFRSEVDTLDAESRSRKSQRATLAAEAAVEEADAKYAVLEEKFRMQLFSMAGQQGELARQNRAATKRRGRRPVKMQGPAKFSPVSKKYEPSDKVIPGSGDLTRLRIP